MSTLTVPRQSPIGTTYQVPVHRLEVSGDFGKTLRWLTHICQRVFNWLMAPPVPRYRVNILFPQ